MTLAIHVGLHTQNRTVNVVFRVSSAAHVSASKKKDVVSVVEETCASLLSWNLLMTKKWDKDTKKSVHQSLMH